jgi:NAD(P)-dependent dehydrogenase (short-subunit alcohol dehydrogenase family)
MPWNLTDRTILITGGNTGLGFATASALAETGAQVVVTSRDPDKGRAAADRIADNTGNQVEVMELDLASLSSVREFAAAFIERHEDLAVLINNAGGIFGSHRVTDDGFEMTIGTNHLGPFLLTNLLTELLAASAPSRIINVASSGHGYAKDGMYLDDLNWERRRYRQQAVYGHSKLANILHVRELNRRLSPQGVTAYAVHPGVVRTEFGSGGDSWIVRIGMKIIGRRLLSPAEGAATSIWAATDPDIVDQAGGYFAECEPARSTRHARDDEQARRLWELSEQLVDAAESRSGPTD